MIGSVELQVISKILSTDNQIELDTLLEYDESFYSVFKEHILFIQDHRTKYGDIPDVFTFQAQFPDVTLIKVTEPLTYLVRELKKNKQQILLVETFNKLKDLGSSDVTDAWAYLSKQCEKSEELSDSRPLNLVSDAKQRAQQVLEFSHQTRIPTGFPEIDKIMYGGLSTVEELVIILARTNTGKSWVCTRMMATAQMNGFPVLYYSPEMQSSYLGTRFDTWKQHFKNNQLMQGNYTKEYIEYIDNLSNEPTGAYVLEDKDVSGESVNVKTIATLVKKHNIKLVIVDGLSYLEDSKHADKDHNQYKNICLDLFKMSKQYGCAVVVAMQANRDTKNIKDDKGDPIPTLFNAESSDHPGRICTQAFALRQVFDKHVLDIRLEKSRNAANQKPVFSYSWDVNTGNMQYIPGDDDMTTTQDVIPTVVPSSTVSTEMTFSDDLDVDTNFDIDEDIEF